MRVAIAGAGDLARYITEELLSASHDVVVLTRGPKPWFEHQGATVRTTDYSASSLAKHLHDCSGLVSTILDYSLASVDVHLALLEACKRSPSCKRPRAQAQQQQVMWTLLNCAWLSEYFIPACKRYIKDIGEVHPVDLNAKTSRIPGTGDEPIGFTAARDVAKAIAQLFAHSTEWAETTFVCGETATWKHVAKKLLAAGRVDRVVHRSLATVVNDIVAAQSEDHVIAAKYELWSVSGAGLLPRKKVQSQREKYFSGVHFRGIDDFLREGYQDDQSIA